MQCVLQEQNFRKKLFPSAIRDAQLQSTKQKMVWENNEHVFTISYVVMSGHAMCFAIATSSKNCFCLAYVKNTATRSKQWSKYHLENIRIMKRDRNS